MSWYSFSTSGYSIYLSDNLVSCSAKKQPTVSRSSCESEYRALALTTAKLLWLTHLLRDLRICFPRQPLLLCDNKSAIFWASTSFLTNGACWVRLPLSSWTCCCWQTSHSVRALSLTGCWYLHQECTSTSFSIFSLQAPRLFQSDAQLAGGCWGSSALI